MKTKRRETSRVLVALDANLRSFASLSSAARLAARRRAELVALFIENSDLMRLADLPFAWEVDHAGEARKLDRSRIEQSMRGTMLGAQRALDEATKAWPVPASIHVVRGRYIQAALSATGDTDVLFLEKRSRIRYAIALHSPVSRQADSVWVFYDGTRQGANALKLAEELCGDQGSLFVMIPQDGKHKSQRIRERLRELLARNHTVHTVSDSRCATLLEAIGDKQGATLVLPRNAGLLKQPNAQAELEASHCAVVVA